ncbi:hypothetical protein ES705_08814 [subsurface metagenome]
MTMRTSREVEADIARLERLHGQTIAVEETQRQAQVKTAKRAEEQQQKQKGAATRRLLAAAEQRRALDIKRDLEWPSIIRSRCFSPALDPTLRAMGLCQSFLDQKQDDWCGQCSRGFENPSWKMGLVHQSKL